MIAAAVGICLLASCTAHSSHQRATAAAGQEKSEGASIVWPPNNAIVAGVQVFRVRLEGDNGAGGDAAAYWSMDGRTRHKMAASRYGRSGLEAEVNTDTWSSGASGLHDIVFAVRTRDRTFREIGRRQVYAARPIIQEEPETTPDRRKVMARLEGVPHGLYNVEWRVDGDQYNLFNEDSNDWKSYGIDVSGWTWRQSEKYVVDYYFSDHNGRVVAIRRSIFIVRQRR